MNSILQTVFGLLSYAFPIGAFLWARSKHKSGAWILVATVIGGIVGGMLHIIPWMLIVGDVTRSPLYVMSSFGQSGAVMGAFIGLLGLLVRGLEGRSKRRA